MSLSNEAAQTNRKSPGSRKRKAFSLLILFGGLLVLAAAAAAAFVALRPVTLKIAVGPAGSDDQKLITALANSFTRERNSVRLNPIVTEGAVESVALLGAGKSDLAVARGDLEMPADAQSVAVLRKNVVVFWTSAAAPAKGSKKAPAQKIKSLEDLPGHKVGIIGRTQANATLLRVILKESGIPSEKVEIIQFATAQIADMAKDPTIDAFMAVGPLDSKLTAEAIAATARLRGEPKFLPIDVSEAIAQKHPLYESEEIPGSTFGTSPARPEDKIETVAVNHLIVARKALSEVTGAALTRQLFAARQSLMKEAPGIVKLETPDTDKDAAIPAHRGAAAYIDGTERTFVERYSDFFWGGLLVLSGLGSGAAWLRSYMKRDEKANNMMLRERVLTMIAQARDGNSLEELKDMQVEVDDILRDTLNCYEDGAIDEGDLSAFGLAFEQFHHAVADRRAMLSDSALDDPRLRAIS
jgi:TRAP transporter TAXI family solute receptor